MRICFLIRSLIRGGSQRQLSLLAKGLAQRGHHVTILAFYPEGDLDQYQGVQNLKVQVLGKRSRWHLISFFLRALRQVRRERPEILQGYLTAANILSVLMKPFLKPARVVWGIRASNMDFAFYNWFLGINDGVERRLSRFADRIIANSQAGVAYSIRTGFPESKMRLVPNGIDTEYFKPDVDRGKAVRKEWGVNADCKLIGLVGRLDPMKDHKTFLRGVSVMAQKHPETKFVCVGSGIAGYEQEMRSLASGLGLKDVLTWAGSRTDLPQVYSALDLFTSASSWGEGFPNVIGEAMSCEIPCVVTDVGDSARVVGDCGIVVPPSDPDALALGWEKALQMGKADLGRRARHRILQNFGTDQLVQKAESIYFELLEDKP